MISLKIVSRETSWKKRCYCRQMFFVFFLCSDGFVFLNRPLDWILSIWGITIQIYNFNDKLFNDINKIVV